MAVHPHGLSSMKSHLEKSTTMLSLRILCVLGYLLQQDNEPLDDLNVTTTAASVDVNIIRSEMERARHRLLKCDGGISFRYRVDCESRRQSPYFFFPEGIDGKCSIKWPKLHNAFSGKLYGVIVRDKDGKQQKVAKPITVKSSFDFMTMTSSTIKDDDTLEIIGRRHEDNGGIIFPFSKQWYVEFSQQWTPEGEFKSDYWLPNAIDSSYACKNGVVLDGIDCVLLEKHGIDRIWLAPALDYSLVRRELNWGLGKGSREKVFVQKTISAGGVSMPESMIFEQYDSDTAEKLLLRLQISVFDFHVGDVSDEDVILSIPEAIRVVKDYSSGIVSVANSGTGEQNSESLLLGAVRNASRKAKLNNLTHPFVWPGLCLSIIICAGLIVVIQRHRRQS